MSPVALGVAGGTGSGKTTVARSLLEEVGRDRISFLAQDMYYRDVDWQSDDQLLQYNFDHPDALDLDLLSEHIQALRRGETVEAPVYNFVVHRRAAETHVVEPKPVILVEGILLFADRRLRNSLDFKIFVDTDADIRLIRRIGRDIKDRGRSIQSVLDQYMRTVRPMHMEFVEPSKRWADVIVPEGGENRVAMEMVIARIEQLLSRA